MIQIIRRMASILALLALAACGADHKWASDAEISAARFVAAPPATITLFTVINNKNGSGAHSSLMINGAERVLYDPAGSWHHSTVPERNDLQYGISDRMLNYYMDYHARQSYDLIEQVIVVTPEIAAMVEQRAIAEGSANQGYCSISVSSILQGVPGFSTISSTYFPKALSRDFGKIAGVTTKVLKDDDIDDHHGVLVVQANGDPGGI